MTNGKEYEREPVTDKGDTNITPETTVSTISIVASSLAGFFLEENVKKGREIEIPSLGIKIEKAKLQEQNGAGSHDSVKDDKERPPKQA